MTSSTSDNLDYTIEWDQENKTFYLNSTSTVNKYYIKNYPNSYYTGEVFGGTQCTSPIVASPKSTKEELLELIKNDYEIGRAIRSLVYTELDFALSNDYKIRQILNRATSSVLWQAEFVEAVIFALESMKGRAVDDEVMRQRFNNVLIPVHRAQESVNDRAVKLV